MHDRWTSYERYPCAHSWCGAHLLCDCVYVAEQEKRAWAQGMFDLLLVMAQAAEQWLAQGAKAIPKEQRDDWIAQYSAILASGFAEHSAQAPPTCAPMPKKSGRVKQDASKHLFASFAAISRQGSDYSCGGEARETCPRATKRFY
jgi:transposase